MARKNNDVVVVFDFDHTLINCDSDDWVLEGFGLLQTFHQLLPTVPCITLMDQMMMEMHSNGKTIEDVEERLKGVCIHPNVVSAIKTAFAHGCDLKIVSDANMLFIETVLNQHGLRNYFSEICTNPSVIDQDGRIRLSPYYDFHSSCHRCSICPPNMCKGLIMKKMRDGMCANGAKRFTFVGDGTPDFCAGLALHKGDYLMARRSFPITQVIESNSGLLNAQVHEWSYGEEFETTLLHLVNKSVDDAESSYIDGIHTSTGLTIQASPVTAAVRILAPSSW